MRADNSIHITIAAKHRHEYTRAKAIAALHELDQAGTAITFEAVADHAGVSRSWLTPHPTSKTRSAGYGQCAQRTPANATPSTQRASEESLRQRLDIATRRNRELAKENQRLRRQIAKALGQLRDENHPRNHIAIR
jgi:hypothetical protein